MTRRVVGMLVVLVLAGSVLAQPGARADASDGIRIHSPAPAPGSLEGAGTVTVQAGVSAAAGVAAVTLSVDGQAVPAVTVTPAAGGAVVRATVDVDPGERALRLVVTDGDGAQAERAWSFTATARTNSRYAGRTRIETAVRVSEAAFSGAERAPAAVLARADDFADALAGVPLAASVGGPLLLSDSSGLPAPTATELTRALEPGATVHLLGGVAALGDQVRRDVAALGFRAIRHAGPDRYATSAAVAHALPQPAAAVLASGASFADALSSSAPAARDGMPVLLTPPDRLPDATAAALAGLEEVTIVGGAAAVTEAVERAVRARVPRVTRVAGPDRYATAVAVLEAFFDGPDAIALASGRAFPDALVGGWHAAVLEQPLLLTEQAFLPAAADDAIRRHAPGGVHVYGGVAAIADHAVRTALRAAEDGPNGVRVATTSPVDHGTVGALPDVTVRFSRAVAGASTLYVEVAGAEVMGTVHQPTSDTLTFTPVADQPLPPIDVAHAGRVVVRARDGNGSTAHHETPFTYLVPDPVFAVAGPVELHLPSPNVEMIGFHQANHHGAQQQTPRGTATPKMTLPSRGRGTGLRTAADIVADPDREVLAPVTGRVVRGGSYVLYCDYTDHFVVIDPDARPGWEVKVLHFTGLQVGIGDRVVAGQTVIGTGPRQLPFRSQVDNYSGPQDWPHLHVEVVDPSIPTPPGRGC